MSEQKHAPEPWRFECAAYDEEVFDPFAWPVIFAGDVELVGTEGFYSELGRDADIANARRIVACVNACAGIRTELLEEVDASVVILGRDAASMTALVDGLERQRDQLLAALKDALEALESYAVQAEGEWGIDRSMEELERCGEVPACIVSARAAIAAAEADK